MSDAEIVADVADDLGIEELVPPVGNRVEIDRWLAEREEFLARAAREWMREEIPRRISEFFGLTAALGDPATLDGLGVAWRSFVTEVIGEYSAGLYLSGSMATWLTGPGVELDEQILGSWLNVVNEQAVAYQATATNRIVGASADLWTAVRERATEAIGSGLSNEDLKDEIEAITGYSEQRADTIARTETVSAYNSGNLQSARALGDAGPVEKVWVATLDARTREWHAEAMDQTVPLEEPFLVGGEPMDSPGAAGGSAGNVVNCRCTMELLYPGDLRPDGSRVPEAPEQP